MKRIFTVSFKCGIHKLIFLDMRMKIFLQIREFPKILETMKKNWALSENLETAKLYLQIPELMKTVKINS